MTVFGLVTRFIEHLYTQLVSTSNYSAITDPHTLQFATARTKSSQSAVFTSRCLVTTSNGGRSRSSGFPNYPSASATSF
jgi:hypothetical protein